MKFLRLKISADILESIDFDYLLEYFEEIELLDFFHYDKNNFFTLERVVFKPKYVDRWREILEETHKISFFDLIDKKRNEITAIMNISRKASFFPLVGSQAWAIVPPTTLDDHSIHINLIASPKILPKIYETLGHYSEKFEILAINDFKKSFKREDNVLFPKFTNRQKEITKYAVRHGYFESPKDITAKEIASNFDISVSAVNEHLRKARKVALEFFFS